MLIVKFGKGSCNNQQPRLAAHPFMLEPIGLCWCYRMRQLLNLICLLFFFASSLSEQILRGLRAGTATSLRNNFPTSPSTAGPCGSGLLALDGYRSGGDKDFEAKKEVKISTHLCCSGYHRTGRIHRALCSAQPRRSRNRAGLRHPPHRQPRSDFPLLRRVRGPESITAGRVPVTTSFPPNSRSTQFLYQVCQNYPAETLPAIFPPGVHVQCR